MAVLNEFALFCAQRGDREQARAFGQRCVERMSANGYELFSASRKAYGRRLHTLARGFAKIGDWEFAQELADKGKAYNDVVRRKLFEDFPQLRR